MTDETDYDATEEEYQNRNDALRHTIDVLASYGQSEIDEFGKKTEIAEEHDVDTQRIHYVLNNYQHLVNYRRNANRDPLNPDAVKEAYQDETLKAMAGEATAVTDGAGEISVEVELSLDEVFRAIKLLPGDLGLKVYSQVLSSDFDREAIRSLLED